MKYKLFYFFIIAGLLAFSSCSKLLEEKSQSEVIPKTTIDFRELLMGSGYMPYEEPLNFLYYMDDDVDFFIEYGNGNGSPVGTPGAKLNYLYYTWQPRLGDQNGLGDNISEDPASTAYYKHYLWIKGCNAVLDYIDNAIGSQQEKDRVRAEALAVRAFYYFRLVNVYGEPYNSNPAGLSVPLKLTSGVTSEYMGRATVAQVYETIVNDLKEASRLMDPLPIARRDYHINQPAIHILLSRVYLHMEKWAESKAEADKVFEQGGMLSDLTGRTTPYWLSYLNPEVEWVFGGDPHADRSTYIPSAAFRATFDTTDIRWKYGFLVQDRTFIPLPGKYLQDGFTLVQTIRTAEAVLNRAEANVQLDKLPEALKDLNDLRRNRIVGYRDTSIVNKTDLLQAVRDERRKEFCNEGYRWFDLRRYGMPAISHRYQSELGEPIQQYTLAEKDPMYVLPFPNSLVLRNPALKQNPSATMPDRTGH
ncbi:RagB/SusD family nutrient uptake outer membrane protein [Chitinophaga sp. SYP-B3965]|uniref:RagB/SusD family nutrient uptake outer membrane protein n=1 Tax=Chitinophaga sp. SYP-B3965 TaxID=2663120 RepID=UPI001299EE0F|nr:RagB/SusD family nutrient uptake outer membrane protein [Chitinophaga sp. SYP-B3965]MRG43580.1 RagB/SusD family nutrient uptake outer membrane protein [Chitinophaga sp. SYP-B3965]